MTILKPTAFHIGRKRALDAQAEAFVYIYARIPQIAEMTLSFHATNALPSSRLLPPITGEVFTSIEACEQRLRGFALAEGEQT